MSGKFRKTLKAAFILMVVLFIYGMVQKNGVKFDSKLTNYKHAQTITLLLKNYTFWPFRYIDRCYNSPIKAYKQVSNGWEGMDIRVINCNPAETRKWLWPLSNKEFDIVLNTDAESGVYKFDIAVDSEIFLDRRYSIFSPNLYNERIISTPNIFITD